MVQQHRMNVSRRRVVFLALYSLPLAACSSTSSGGAGDDQATIQQVGGTDSPVLGAPDVVAAPIKSTGQLVQPITGIGIYIPTDTSVLMPEKLADGRTSVTYVWPVDKAWGYLTLEGPNSFPVGNDAEATRKAADGERERLVSALITPSEARSLTWPGFPQCSQMTWTQTTVPPGWSEQTQVDALALFLVDGASRAYTVVAYAAHVQLVPSSSVLSSLCSVNAL